MKYFIITAVLFISCFVLNAQVNTGDTLKNKRGIPILPTKGSYGLGIDATPFLMYLGNFFNKDHNYTPTFGSVYSPVTISGKYFFEDKTALIARFSIGYSHKVEYSGSVDETQQDKLTNTALSLGLLAGIEKYIGTNSRLRGNYGAFIVLEKSPYLTLDNWGNTYYEGKIEFEDGTSSVNDYTIDGGSSLGIGLGAKIGVEYFFAPKMSLGGDLYLIGIYNNQSARIQTISGGDDISIEGKSNSLDISTEGSGLITLHFYF
jgi:hypothetical protein